MAARAPVVHDYSFGGARRPRREVWYSADDEPVVLPRRGDRRPSGALLASALVAVGLTASFAYALYAASTPADQAPQLAAPEPATLVSTWAPDSAVFTARATEELNGPARSVPGVVEGLAAEDPSTAHEAVQAELGGSRLESSPRPVVSPPPPLIAEPAAPAASPAEAPAPQAPYPNPTTTPPEAIAPAEPAPAPSPPPVEAENPY